MSNNSSDESLKIRLEMKSDWHIGTGAGIPGSIDALLARDGDGFPCVPAKTIVGIWRDALETLTWGLDNGGKTKRVWQKWVDVIFGSQPNQPDQNAVQELVNSGELAPPRPAVLSIEPARLDESLRGAIGADEGLKQALTFIKPNTAVDSEDNSDSGAAKTGSLRFTEMGRIETVLEAEFKLDFDILENVSSEQKELIKALLVAGAALVERIGGNRRRGSGKCEIRVEGLMSKEDAVKAIGKYQTPPAVPSCKRQSSGSADAPQSASGIEWRKIEYKLKLQTPVAIVTNTLGNVSETLDFIPGTYLLPHITRQLNGISKYVAAGDFQVSSATIEINQARGLPVPKVFLQEKMDESNVCNRLKETEESLKEKLQQPKPLREGFVAMENGNFTHVKTPSVLLMHNTVRDDIQRPDETVGGVFSRQAIKAGTTLRGEIRFKGSLEGEVESLENHISDVRLGTSKKDDYGLAKLALGKLEDDKSSVTPTKELIVYLESDVLLRNANLRQTNLVEAVKTELEKYLGKGTLKSTDEVIAEAEEKLERNPNDEESEKIVKEKKGKDSLIQVRRIESWHEGWGFPRPTLTAMAAGSVVVFDVIGAIDQPKFQNLELSGIGERRGEGYGRICFNPPLLMNPINNWIVPTKTKPATNGGREAREKLKAEILNAKKLGEFVSIIELSAWRDELARAVLKLANDKDQRKKIFGFDSDEKIPSMSQIGGLRSAFRRLEKPKDENVIGWLEHVEKTSNRLEKWGKNKNKDEAKEKLEVIKKLINDESEVWKTLRQIDSNGRSYLNLPTEFVTPRKDIQTGLWAEAVRSLFDACARTHKRDTED